jgi:hypothetical protein
MHTFVWIAILAVFVFLLTYDPSSKKLDKYIKPDFFYSFPEKKEQYSSSSERYQNLIFGQSSSSNTDTGETKEYKGAII